MTAPTKRSRLSWRRKPRSTGLYGVVHNSTRGWDLLMPQVDELRQSDGSWGNMNSKYPRYTTFKDVLFAVRDLLPNVQPRLFARVADRCRETDEPVLDALNALLLSGVDHNGFRRRAKHGRGGHRKRARRNARTR
jgi:hypothetical protein